MKRWRIRGTDTTFSSGTGLVIAVVAIIVGSLGIATWAMVILMALLIALSTPVPPAGPPSAPE
jgi:multisubunit Na+/H+ antiporter MnhG subunit